MYSYSQKIEITIMIVALIMYFCGITYAQQNAWIYIFSIALICWIVGIYVSIQMHFSSRKEILIMNLITRIGRGSRR